MEWGNDLIIEFLNAYEGEPAIWDPKNPQHKDRNATHDAWKRIQVALRTDVSLKELKKKKECLMSTYRKLAAKVKKSKGTGSAASEEYKPEWFAFEKMDSFLRDVYIPRETQHAEAVSEDDGKIQSKRAASKFISESPKRIKTLPDAHKGKVFDSPSDFLECFREDDCDIVGKMVANKLRKMNDLQRIFAEKLINDVLYKGMLEQLNETNYIGDSNK